MIPFSSSRGYTLVELIVSVGLFSLVMMLSAGAYFITINVNRQAQGVTLGIDSISFVVERMARNIRTGTNYSCLGAGDCLSGGGTFSFRNVSGETVTYSLNGETLQEVVDGGLARTLTNPSSVTITHMRFYLSGSSSLDTAQPHVTVVIGGTTSIGGGRVKTFLIETGATMRGIDL